MRFFVRHLVFLAAFLPCLAAEGTMAIPLSLRQMTEGAGKIFFGKCLSEETLLDENRLPSTYYRFRVSRGLKGASDGETVLIKQFGVSRRPIRVPEGESAVVPFLKSISREEYRVGEEYLLFLYPESSIGFTSPVGGGQGMFRLRDRRLESSFPTLEGGDVDEMIREIERLVDE